MNPCVWGITQCLLMLKITWTVFMSLSISHQSNIRGRSKFWFIWVTRTATVYQSTTKICVKTRTKQLVSQATVPTRLCWMLSENDPSVRHTFLGLLACNMAQKTRCVEVNHSVWCTVAFFFLPLKHFPKSEFASFIHSVIVFRLACISVKALMIRTFLSDAIHGDHIGPRAGD